MSLGDAISKKRMGLKATSTRLTLADGSVLTETRSADGFEATKSADSAPFGFVIDTKPDLQIAEVFPWLCFGSQDVACDESLLQSNAITSILSLGVEVPQLQNIEYHFFEALDLPEFDLLHLFDKCYHVIESVRNAQGKIYVHCNAGISRSSSVVIAYHMKFLACSLKESMERVKSVRPCARPNPGFLEQLQIYEKTLHER